MVSNSISFYLIICLINFGVINKIMKFSVLKKLALLITEKKAYMLVTSLEVTVADILDKNIVINSSREKRQIGGGWAYLVETNTEVATRQQNENEPPTDPCAAYNPSVPDFRRANRRISDIKCYKYIWQLKRRDEIDKRLSACIEQRQKMHTKFQFGQKGGGFAVGGRSTSPGEFPHMGAIGWKASIGTWVFKCGSSLISEKYLLTAAHCSRASSKDTSIADPVPKIVRLGDKNIIDVFANGQVPHDANITNIIVHPKYASPRKYFDIAIIEIDKPVLFTKYVQPACLWTNFDTSTFATQATLTGWGVIESGGRTISPELQAAVVDTIDTKTCNALLRSSCNRLWCGVEEHQICAGKLAGGVDACQGDSGGPLQVKIDLPITTEGQMHYIIGITSFGIGCARANIPGIYTRVSSFVDWIESIVWPGN